MEPTAADAIIERIRKGDLNAYGLIIQAYDVDVRVVLGAILPDRSLVEDAAQETFITAYYKLDSYEPGTDIRAWLKTIARNIGRNLRRRWTQRTQASDAYRQEMHQALEKEVVQRAESLSGDVSRALRDCVSRLKQDPQTAVHLHYEQGMTCNEVAAALKRTTGWVKTTLCRARLSLARCLQAKGVLSHG